jgi:hypothetical protein
VEYVNAAADPQAALERAYPRWHVWQAAETGEWWAAVRANLTKREQAAGCESYRSAETPGDLALLLNDEDATAGVSRSLVRLVAWGRDEIHLGQAYAEFALHPVRSLWRVADTVSSSTGPCPVSVDDPAVIVAHAGDGWLYAVYPAGAA